MDRVLLLQKAKNLQQLEGNRPYLVYQLPKINSNNNRPYMKKRKTHSSKGCLFVAKLLQGNLTDCTHMYICMKTHYTTKAKRLVMGFLSVVVFQYMTVPLLRLLLVILYYIISYHIIIKLMLVFSKCR